MTTTTLPPAPATTVASRSRWLPRDERSLFLLGTAVVALHVLDDTLLQPPAGTTAADHLVGALVPTALLAAAAWRFGRVRAGWRAVLALSVGVFGIGIGMIEAGYYTTAVGPSGDDFTGLLAIPAGALLVGLGLWRLWQSRRRTGPLWRRLVRRSMHVVVAVLAAYFVVQPVLFAYAVTHVQRAVVPEDELGVAHEDVTFTTSDGLTLHGWYIPSRNGAAIVDFPGRLGTQAHARMLAEHGYGVLLFDRRGEGRSEGGGNMLGWGGDKDIIAAVDWLKRRPDVDPDRIGGIGLSVGGELMLEAAAKDPDLAAVVSDGAGARQFREQKEALPGAGFWVMSPAFALLNAVGGGVLRHGTTRVAVRSGPAHRAAPAAVHLRARRRQRDRGPDPGLRADRRTGRVAVGRPGRPAHQGDQDRTDRVRAAGRRLLRRGAARALTDVRPRLPQAQRSIDMCGARVRTRGPPGVSMPQLPRHRTQRNSMVWAPTMSAMPWSVTGSTRS